MPSFEGATGWINTEPLDLEGLRGRVVVVDFWTLTCINWLRTEPYIRAWSRAYRDDGLVAIGVHTPEFSFEHEIDRVRKATTDMDIDYPVVLGNDYAIWQSFDNHYWPALYFIDKEGVVRDQHFGEGRYEQSERVIQELLGIDRTPVSVRGVGPEQEADWDNLRSPETYLGYTRTGRFEAPDERAEELRLNRWSLAGDWEVESEKVLLREAGGSIAFRFHARDAHLVLSPGTSGPIPFQVRLGGEAPGASHGVDVDANGNGVLEDGRMYQLIRTDGGVRDRTLEIAFDKAGAEAYVFTFG